MIFGAVIALFPPATLGARFDVVAVFALLGLGAVLAFRDEHAQAAAKEAACDEEQQRREAARDEEQRRRDEEMAARYETHRRDMEAVNAKLRELVAQRNVQQLPAYQPLLQAVERANVSMSVMAPPTVIKSTLIPPTPLNIIIGDSRDDE